MRKLACVCFALLFSAATVAPAKAGTIIEGLIGDQSFAPLDIGLEDPANAVNIDGVLHITGFSEGIGALQMIDLTTGVAGPVQQFHSLNGLGGRAAIGEVVQLNDGRVIYLGSGELGANDQVATYWIGGVDNPIVADADPNSDGFLAGAASGGTFVGFNDFGAAVGLVGGTLQALPGTATVAGDITSDARYIVGDSIWVEGDNGYQTVSTLGFDLPTNGAGLPTLWSGTAIDPVTGQAVFAGSYVDLTTFQTNTGFWNEDGVLLGTFDGLFQDFEVWEGQLVAGLNGYDDDGHLIAISDFSSLAILTITGQKSTLHQNGLFVGSAGFLLDGPNGPMVTTYETNGTTAVPEPSTFVLSLLGTIGLWLKNRGNEILGQILPIPFRK